MEISDISTNVLVCSGPQRTRIVLLVSFALHSLGAHWPWRSTLRLLICCALKACHGRWPCVSCVFGVVVEHSGRNVEEWDQSVLHWLMASLIKHWDHWECQITKGAATSQQAVCKSTTSDQALQQVCPIQLLCQPSPEVPSWQPILWGEDRGSADAMKWGEKADFVRWDGVGCWMACSNYYLTSHGEKHGPDFNPHDYLCFPCLVWMRTTIKCVSLVSED